MKPVMKLERFLPFLAFVLAAFACNWSEVAPPAAPVIEPSPLPTFAISTLTPIPTQTSLPTPTSTPGEPIAWPKNQGVNCRFGPGQEWEVVSTIPLGTIAEIKGRVVNTSWWYVRDPMKLDESFCWVAYDVVDTAGNLNVIPIAEPPVAAVTSVTVDSVVVAFTSCEGSNQVRLNGIIAANGPASVTYHWEISGTTQDSTSEATLKFSLSGTQDVTTSISLKECGEYTAILRVTEPNTMFDQKTFKIQSP